MAYSDSRDADTALSTELVLGGSVGDYIALLKPRVMSLVVFTAFVGMAIAPVALNPVIGVLALLAIAVGAGASGALNMWYDADIDAVMRRTMKRPVPAGRLTAGEALAFGLPLAVGSVVFLGLATNVVAAGLLAFTIAFYVIVYTMWLKRSTPQNIVIGGAAGALPPMVGWAAATGGIGVESITLFLIIFLWTPPHFWALSLYKCEDYAKAGIPMLPVVAGEATTKRHILAYAVVLAVVAALLPPLTGVTSWTYAVIAGGLGAVFVGLAWQVFRMPAGDAAKLPARRLFTFSLLYLFLLFAVILAEKGLTGIAA
jgi:protoheme IX farnesyltransferase